MTTNVNQRITIGQRITIPWLLFAIFLTLKLCGVIAWSWLWVFAPLWIPIAFAIVCFIIASVLALLAARGSA